MNTIRKNIGPFIIFFLFFTCGLILSLSFAKTELQLSINSLFHPVGNAIFLFFTKLAEGWFTVPLFAFLFYKNWRKAIFLGSSYALSALIAQIFKRLIFTGYKYNRPLGTPELFRNPEYQWLSDELPKYNSFPSGHTTTAFCIFIGLALITANKKLGIAFAIIACLVGISRVYLSCHYVADITAGSLLGTACSLGLFLMLRKKLSL